MGEEFSSSKSLSAHTRLPNSRGRLRQRPIFERFRLAGQRLRIPRRGDQAEQSQLQRESRLDRLCRGRLAGLVVDDRKASVGKTIDPVGLAIQLTPASSRLPGRFRRIGRRPCSGLSFPRLWTQWIASISRGDHKRPQHRMDVSWQVALGPRQQLSGLHSSSSASLRGRRGPRCPSTRRVVGVDRVELAELEDQFA